MQLRATNLVDKQTLSAIAAASASPVHVGRVEPPRLNVSTDAGNGAAHRRSYDAARDGDAAVEAPERHHLQSYSRAQSASDRGIARMSW